MSTTPTPISVLNKPDPTTAFEERKRLTRFRCALQTGAQTLHVLLYLPRLLEDGKGALTGKAGIDSSKLPHNYVNNKKYNNETNRKIYFAPNKPLLKQFFSPTLVIKRWKRHQSSLLHPARYGQRFVDLFY
jgi:hypothetical protein